MLFFKCFNQDLDQSGLQDRTAGRPKGSHWDKLLGSHDSGHEIAAFPKLGKNIVL